MSKKRALTLFLVFLIVLMPVSFSLPFIYVGINNGQIQISQNSCSFSGNQETIPEDYKVIQKINENIISPNADSFNRFGAELNVDPRILASIVATEWYKMMTTTHGGVERVLGSIPILESWFSTIGIAQMNTERVLIWQTYLKDPTSQYYLGEEFENYLSNDPLTLDQIQYMLKNDKEFSIKVEAVFVAMHKKAWKNYLTKENELYVLPTLYNIGFRDPHPNPQSGGTIFDYGGEKINFGDFAKMWSSDPRNVPEINDEIE